MSGVTVALHKRSYCEAGGRSYKAYWRFAVPNEDHMLNCPVCGKRVTLKVKADTGEYIVIPRHLQQIVGL